MKTKVPSHGPWPDKVYASQVCEVAPIDIYGGSTRRWRSGAARVEASRLAAELASRQARTAA